MSYSSKRQNAASHPRYFEADNDGWLGAEVKKPFRLYYLASTLSFVLFVPPEGLAYTSLSSVRNAWWALLFLNCGVLLLVYVAQSCLGKGKRLDSVFIFALLTCMPLCFFTFANDGSWLQLLKKITFFMGPWLYLAVFGEYGFKPLLKSMLLGSLFIVSVNALSIALMYSHGSFRPQYGDTWLFGQRTFMRNFLYPTLLFCMLEDRLRGKRFSLLTLAVVAVSLYSVIVGDAMTTLVVLIVMLLCVVLSWQGLRETPIFRVFLYAAVILDAILVHLRKIEIFQSFIEDVLNRNMTLSYRTQAWDIAIDWISEMPLEGTGFNNLDESGIVVGFGKALSNVHNQILDVWFKGGVLALAFFGALVARCVSPIFKRSHLWAAFAIGIVLGGFFIEAVVSEVWYPQFYLLLYLSAYLKQWAYLFEKEGA